MKMKRLKILLLLVGLIYANVCNAQSGWVWQNPLPQGNDLTSVQYFSSDLIYVFSDAGTYMKTTNSGLNWEFTNLIGGFGSNNCAKTLSASFFLNSSTGFVTTASSFDESWTENNRILKTTNSGFTWDSVTANIFPSFKTIFFINQMTGWSCCSYSQYSSNINRVLKTTDGGVNWFIQNTSLGAIYASYFINSNTGWFTGYYQLPYPASSSAFYIYKTTDGGSTFVTQLFNSTYQELKTVYFINENSGWAGGTNIWKTTDGGGTWNSQNVSANTITFINNLTGYCANNSAILKTTNAGTNWIVQLNGTGGNSIAYLGEDKVIAVGLKGSITKTTNRGNNWDLLSQSVTSNPITNIRFLNSNTGFCIHHYWSYPPYPGTVLKTTDKGFHWVVNFENTLHDLSDIFFIDELTGWIAGYTGKIYKTTNTGTYWFEQNSNTVSRLHSVYFINQNTGWIIGDSSIYGCVLKTTNSGLNWVKSNIIGQDLNNMKDNIIFINNNTGFIVGIGGIGKTTNGGANWQRIFSYSMQDISLDSLNNVFAISLSQFYKSTDLGESWQLISTPAYAGVDLEMLNSTTGYIACLRGSILKTTNGGVNWSITKLPTNKQLRSIFAIDTSQCWVSGDQGLIMSTVGQGMITSTINSNTFIANGFLLSQNYPNPFNPQTKIKFAVPKASYTKLIIYDLLGREVATLINEELKSGTYEADWVASDFSSGVYFYKIITEGFVETKKMVLMK